VTAPLVVVATRWRWSLVPGVAGCGRSAAEAIAHEITRVLDAVDDRIVPTRVRIDIARRAVGRIGSAVVRSSAERPGVPATVVSVELRGELLDSPGLVEGAA
jgi:hypothetical protein